MPDECNPGQQIPGILVGWPAGKTGAAAPTAPAVTSY
jgi:hypothetical protein